MKRRLIVIVFSIIILASVCAILYPLAANYLYEKQQDTIITDGLKLPQTGGEGSMAMIVGGMAVAAPAGFAVVAMLRKKNVV